MGCRGCSTISLGAARGAPYPGAATLRPRPPSPARPEGLRETGPEPHWLLGGRITRDPSRKLPSCCPAQQSSGAPRPRWPQGRVGARSLDTLWPHLIQTSPGSRLHRRRRCFPRTRDRMLC
ncbi:unnamed protein product [Rangifer tarandus platyrhynchus]|uniref:Uncharacterized protein n=1 Tax=Rangifer tarandus platyrhynchus TaxID=3082113 RepID=A0AC59Y8U5_RANTA